MLLDKLKKVNRQDKNTFLIYLCTYNAFVQIKFHLPVLFFGGEAPTVLLSVPCFLKTGGRLSLFFESNGVLSYWFLSNGL